MAQQFLLSLSNPDITKGDAATIYTDTSGGNKLDISLTNNTGYPLKFTNDSDLLIKFPKTIMNEDGIKAITVAKPWVADGYYIPEKDPDSHDKGAFYVLKLKAPVEGILFKTEPLILSLAAVTPSEKGNASVFVSYSFADGAFVMNPSATLTAIASPSDNDKPLIGDENALRMSVIVNDGPDTNPLVYTASDVKVTAANAAENLIHMNFIFQDQNLPGGSGGGLGELVEKWNKNTPPTFQIQFPYFSGSSASAAAPYDLTDALSQGEEGYNNYTSAQNIKLSLSSTDPSILSNEWWVITPPEKGSHDPFWKVQPTPQNAHVFTGLTQGKSASGPFLDLFFSHIYSNLPIDPDHPETIVYVETYDFPKFNDHLTQLPLFKEDSVKIKDFTGEIITQGGTTTLQLTWETDNTEYCLISGGNGNQPANNSTNPYRQTINLTHPLRNSYTLTAVGKDGVSKLERTIQTKWVSSSKQTPQDYDNPGPIQVSPDGETLFLVSDQSLIKLESATLVQRAKANPPNNGSAKNVVVNEQGNTLYLATLTTEGEGKIYVYDTDLGPIGIGPASPGSNASVDLFPMALSQDGSQLVINQAYPNSPTGPELQSYLTETMTESIGSPLLSTDIRGIGIAIDGDHIYYPDSKGLGVLDRKTMNPIAESPVSLKSDDKVNYYPGPITVSPDGKTVATLALGYHGADRIFILCTIDVTTMSLKKRVQVTTGYSSSPYVVSTGLAYSQDGQYLFAFGTDYSAGNTNHDKTIFNAYDPDALKELPWSPVSVEGFYGSIALAPDGSQIYASTLNSTTPTDPTAPLKGRVRTLTPTFE